MSTLTSVFPVLIFIEVPQLRFILLCIRVVRLHHNTPTSMLQLEYTETDRPVATLSTNGALHSQGSPLHSNCGEHSLFKYIYAQSYRTSFITKFSSPLMRLTPLSRSHPSQRVTNHCGSLLIPSMSGTVLITAFMDIRSRTDKL